MLKPGWYKLPGERRSHRLAVADSKKESYTSACGHSRHSRDWTKAEALPHCEECSNELLAASIRAVTTLDPNP